MQTVLVSVSEVATLHDDFEFDGVRVSETYLNYEFNEWDEYALETAVQYAEAHDDVEVVTVTIGPERAEETIRTALAKGADRAIRVWDDALESADFLGPESKASILEAVVDDVDPAFVLTGVQVGDAAFASTGVTLAEKLGDQWAAVVTEVDLDRDDGRARVHRELEGGVDEITDVDLPAVLTVQTGINDPRYASLRGIRQAQKKELAVASLADYGLDASVAESDLTIVAASEPESEGDATIFEGDADETAADLANLLSEKGVGEA